MLLEQQQQALARQQQLDYQMALEKQQQQQQEAMMRQMQASTQSQIMGTMEVMREQHVQDQRTISQYSSRLQELEGQLAQLRIAAPSPEDVDRLRRLEEDLAAWKTKYEALAKMYAQLRKEHLELLKKLKEHTAAAAEAKKLGDAQQAELRTQAALATQLQIDKTRLQAEADRLRGQVTTERDSLARDLDAAKRELAEMAKTRGSETTGLMALFEAEKGELHAQLRTIQARASDLQASLDEARAQAAQVQATASGDAAVLQAGLDQALLALAAQQKSVLAAREEVAKEHAAGRGKQTQLLDTLLAACAEGVGELQHQQGGVHGITGASGGSSPEFVLVLLDKAQNECAELGASYIRLLQGGDQFPETMRVLHSFSRSLATAVQHARGMSSMEDGDAVATATHDALASCIQESKRMLDNLQSVVVQGIADASKRPPFVLSLSKDVSHAFSKVATALEPLKLRATASPTGPAGDVDAELRTAAAAIQAAAAKLQQLLNTTPTGKLQVHGSILQAALAITGAIANLIRYATLTQQEIVTAGRGAASALQFYKKNNTWTEGLISSAQYVGACSHCLCCFTHTNVPLHPTGGNIYHVSGGVGGWPGGCQGVVGAVDGGGAGGVGSHNPADGSVSGEGGPTQQESGGPRSSCE
jgi:huntingtin-interacting protein 1-related protein